MIAKYKKMEIENQRFRLLQSGIDPRNSGMVDPKAINTTQVNSELQTAGSATPHRNSLITAIVVKIQPNVMTMIETNEELDNILSHH